RDFHVTGVQTCALPISEVVPGASVDAGIAVCTAVALIVAVFGYDLVRKMMAAVSVVLGAVLLTALVMALGNPAAFATGRELAFKIGRASCRENGQLTTR